MKKIHRIILTLLMMLISVSVVHADSISINLINQDPDPAKAGEIVEIRLGIENIGTDTVNNLIIELEPEFPLELVPGDNSVLNIGTIRGYQDEENVKIVKFKLKVNKDANAGSYELKVKYYFTDSPGKTEKSIFLDVKSIESAEVIYIDKTTLLPGKQTGIKFTVNNVGNAPLRDITFSWVNADNTILPVGSGNTKYIKFIDVGGSAEVDYQVMADSNAVPALYKLDISLTYDVSITGEKNTLSTIAGVYVGGGTDFDVAFSESSAGETSFSVANIGSNPAFSVSVIVPDQRGWRVSGPNSVIIGNLNKGDYTIASFGLQSMQRNVTTTEPQNSENTDIQEMMRQRTSMQSQDTLKIQIAYTNTMGERDIIEKEVALNSRNIGSNPGGINPRVSGNRAGLQQQNALIQNQWYIAGFVILVIGSVSYGKYRKRKLMDPQFTIRDIFHEFKLKKH